MTSCSHQQRTAQGGCHLRQRCGSMVIRLASSLMLLLLAPRHCAAANTFIVDPRSEAAASTTPTSPFEQVQHLTLVFPLKPLSQPPTPPPAYQTYPVDQWKWRGGPGYFLVTKSDYGLFGTLTEAWYLPGRYQPKCSSRNGVYYSAQRLWVDMEVSRSIGRQVWGFPKEMANFEWGPTSVTLKDTNGKNIFSARFTNPLNKPSPAWLTSFANNGLDTTQWPIQDTSGGSSLLNIQFDKGAQAGPEALITAQLLPKPLVTVSTTAVDAAGGLTPNIQHLGFNGSSPDAIVPAPGYKQLKLVRATNVQFYSKAFTGRVGKEVQLLEGFDVGFIKGTPGSLHNPVQYNC